VSSDHDGLEEPAWDRPAGRPAEGALIGDGRIGTMVWTTPGTMELQISRMDACAVSRDVLGERIPGRTDLGGGCGRITIGVGGDPFHAGPAFRRRLSPTDRSGRGAVARVSPEAPRGAPLPYAPTCSFFTNTRAAEQENTTKVALNSSAVRPAL
jgi:hypothetical protein